MKRYSYVGPVLSFGKCITERWLGETVAPSEKKALSNLCYQYKKEHNRTANYSITLPGKLYIIGFH